jgi:hypothetical protein
MRLTGGRKIIYTDETWIFTGMSATYGWIDDLAWDNPSHFDCVGLTLFSLNYFKHVSKEGKNEKKKKEKTSS